MAQRIGPPGTARIAISGSHMNHPWANVFWAMLGGGVSATQAGFDAYVSAFGEAYASVFGPSLSNQTSIGVAAGVLFQSPTQVLHSVHSMTHNGLVSAAYVTDASACTVLSWTTNAYWRGGKPRTYLPGVEQQYNLDNSKLSPAGDLWFTERGADWIVSVNGLSAAGITQSQFGFVHFFSAGVLLNPGVFYPITGVQVHPRFGTQRRRLGKWTP